MLRAKCKVMLILIAWKNIWRNKLRSFIVITAMTLGMIGGIISAAVMAGASSQSLDDARNDYASEIQIHHPKYIDNNELSKYIENASKIKQFISEIEGVQTVTSRVKILGMIQSTKNTSGIFINVIDPETEKTVTNIHSRIDDSHGSYFECDRKYPIVISEKTADLLKIKLNSKVVLSFVQLDTTYSGGAFRVCGIYKTFNSGYDAMNVFIQETELHKISSLPENISHELAVRVPKDEDLLKVKEEILPQYPDLSVRTWKEQYAELALMNDMMDKMIYVFLIIILLALGFGIVNTMLMAVLERIKEFGMLMAVGMSKRRVFKMIMYETIFLSSVGGIIGMAVSWFILLFKSKSGFDFSKMEEGFEKFGFAAKVYPDLEPTFFFVLSFLIILTGIIAAIYPAKKAVKLNPVEALRTE